MKKIYLIAVVIALAAGLATYFFANELKTNKIVTGVDEATVLVALQDIDENTVILAEMFTTVKMPASAVSHGTVSNIIDIIGYMSCEKILKGEQLMARKLVPIAKTDERSDRLSYELDNGMYAYSIYVKEENAVSYFLKEQDRINIYNNFVPSAEPALENVPVIRIGDYAAELQQEAGTETTSYVVITLALTKEQIPKMMELESPDKEEPDKQYRIVLVSHIEAHDLADDIANADIPENQNPEPVTNYGLGEIVTEPPKDKE